MIYVTFDSNIWLNLLDNAWKEENPLDHLEHWIDEGHITILLPEIITTEWNNNREKGKNERRRKLKEFFLLAEEIFPTSFIENERKPENIDKIIESQFQRIEILIKSKATTLSCSQNTKDKVFDWGLQKKAPMHKKTSIADATIIFSLFEFADVNAGHEYIFVTENKDDFCEKEASGYKIHKDLEDDFKRCKIEWVQYLNKLIYDLRQKLPVTIDIESRRRERLKNKVAQPVYNPEVVKALTTRTDAYLENTKLIDIILKTDNPTTQQILFIFGTIDSHESYKTYFYRNVSKPVWFNILKGKGIFNYQNNPAMVKVTDGFQIPMWEPLFFLEKLSIEIKEGKSPELIEELIEIITKVSEHPIDNYRTWAFFLRIIGNIPNEKAPKELLNFIPVWLDGRFDTMLVTVGLCENLLPKFLNDSPTSDDITKAEIILGFLLDVKKKDLKEGDSDASSYYSRLYLHFFKQTFIEKGLAEKTAKYCSDDIILKLGRLLKKLLLDYPEGINAIVNDNGKEFEVRAYIDESNLQITARTKGETAWPSTQPLNNYSSLSDDQLKNEVITILKAFGIDYLPQEGFEDFYNRINFGLNTDLTSSFGFNTIRQLGDRFHHGEKLLEVFSLVFREILNYKVKINPDKGKELLFEICNNEKYRIPYFKRIAMYIVAENWEPTKEVFFDLIKDNDRASLFSIHRYSKDLYELLDRVQLLLDEREKGVLNAIIDKGCTGDEKEHQNFWKLRWYSALKNIDPFSEKYIELSSKENITSDTYENSGKIQTRVGHISPITEDELMNLKGEEIAKYIKDFKPENTWDEPTIDGLADVLGKAVVKNPVKFADEINHYNKVPFIYVYHILISLKEAVRKGIPIDKNKVVIFCYEYVSSPDFYSEKGALPNDGWRANSEWVVGAISNFITDCTQNDANSIDISLQDTVKRLIILLVEKLKPSNLKEKLERDYPTYSFNSTAGKTLRALLDYSLWRARNLVNVTAIKWEPEIKALFTDSLQKSIIDGYILEGLYFSQFLYLDKDWSLNEQKERLKEGGETWHAFISGLVFGNGSLDPGTYNVLLPQYEKMLAVKIDKNIRSGLIRHIVIFYFYGYEDLKSESLIRKLVDTGEPEAISELIAFIWQQEEYYNSLQREERSKFEKIIKELWEYLLTRFGKTKKEEEKDVLNGIIHFVPFVPELDESYAKLLLDSAKALNKKVVTHHLMEDFVPLVNKGTPLEVAKLFAPILLEIPFNEYISDFEAEPIKTLVRFLYENNQKDSANTFCHKISSLGNDFLKPLYTEFNP